MIDIHALREAKEPYIESMKRRGKGDPTWIEQALELDDTWRTLKGQVDELRAQRNKASEAINKAKKAGEDASEHIARAKEIPAQLKKLELEEQDALHARNKILNQIPNILHNEVPEGKDESHNVEKKTYGEKTELTFEPKNHVELAETLGIADFEAARRVSGAGWYFLEEELALLDLALQRYALDVMIEEGFNPVIPPFMVRKEVVEGMVDIHTFDELMYKIEEEDLHPIATSEFSLVGKLIGQDVDERTLPRKMVGISPCFRKEKGAHGIDERGLYRTHQFMKVEQVVVCTSEQSNEWFDKLLEITARIFTGLGIHVRQLEMCAGDLGGLKHRQIDIEAWSARRKEYFEVGSCSNLTDAQARRLGIKLVHPNGERSLPHTLNNTALATSRAMVAILENFQDEQGNVHIPEILHPYMYGRTVIKPK